MTRPDMIVIDRSELRWLIDEVSQLKAAIQSVQITPRPEWVTVAEAAKIAGVSQRTIRDRIAAGKVQAKDFGGTRMVRV